jgi:hypothetical protein
MSPLRLRAAALGAVVTLTVLVGCSGAPEPTASGSAPTTDQTLAAPDEPGHGDVPGSRSGDLGQEDLPHPSALGERWRYRIDEGDPEEGYQGSGEPAIARRPASVIEAITPLGCRPQPMPRPTHALEVTYQRGEVPGVGLVLDFSADRLARSFFAAHVDVLVTCQTADRVDVDVRRTTSDTVVSTRTEELGHTPTWVEGARVDADTVTFIAVADPGPGGVRTVESALRHLP